MPRTRIENLGQYGLITDIPKWRMPANAFTRVQNMRMEYSAAKNFGSRENVIAIAENPYHLLPFNTGVDYYWIIQCDNKVYAWDGSTITDITSTTGYSSFSATAKWSGIVLGQIVYQAHPNIYPEYWNGVIPGQFAPLIYDGADTWEDNGIYCDILRGHNNYLIALGITDSGTYYPHLVKWSNPAAPGTIPDSWDHTVAVNRAGENDIADNSGLIIDGLPLREHFVIYKDNSIWNMNYRGGHYVWTFKQFTQTIGAMASDCISEFKGVHIVFDRDDIYQYNGSDISTLIDKKIRQLLINNISSDYYYKSYVVNHRPRKEMWFCFPLEGSLEPDLAVIWNWKDNTWTHREINSVRHMARGTAISAPETWDSTPDSTWDNWIGPWGSRNYDAVRDTIMGVDTNKDMNSYDSTLSVDAPDYTSILERTDLLLPEDNIKQVNIVTEVWPIMSSDQPVQIEIGSQMVPNGPVRWEQPQTFQPGVDRKINVRSVGALHAYRIKSDSKVPWEITDIEIQYEPTGDR